VNKTEGDIVHELEELTKEELIDYINNAFFLDLRAMYIETFGNYRYKELEQMVINDDY
jgi:hypothetical protein